MRFFRSQRTGIVAQLGGRLLIPALAVLEIFLMDAFGLEEVRRRQDLRGDRLSSTVRDGLLRRDGELLLLLGVVVDSGLSKETFGCK